MDKLPKSNVLLVQPFLFNLAGSEIVTMELAEALRGIDAKVTIVSWGWSEKLALEVSMLSNVVLLKIDSPDFEQYLNETTPDLIWVHQGLVPKQLVTNTPQKTKLVFAHLSSINSFERPFAPQIEEALADGIFFVSPRAEAKFNSESILTGIPADKKHIFYNPVPLSFHQVTVKKGPLASVLVVSNHLPQEVIKAIELLRNTGETKITVVGANQPGIDAHPQRVTAELIAEHNCIISSGKTVQYGLCSGTPVYCYDHFGGPGWLNAENYEKALYSIFSGQDFQHKSAQTIFEEITTGFTEAQEFASEKVDEARALFTYDRILDILSEILDQPTQNRNSIPHEVVEGFLSAHETVKSFGLSHYNAAIEVAATNAHARNVETIIAETNTHVRNLETIITETNRSLDDSASHIEQLSGSLEVSSAHIKHLEKKVAEAHYHLAARSPRMRIQRLKAKATTAIKSIFTNK